MAKQVRQITPPAIRIWLVGIGATSLAWGANVGWLWLCTNVFNLKVLVPTGFQSTTYVEATQLRIAIATSIAGLIATVIAVVLSKLLIGPRIWFLVSGLAVGLTSIYGAVTLPDISLTVKFSLSVMHILATGFIVLPIAEALKIRESDLHRADLEYHEHFDNKNAADAGVVTTSTAGTQASNEAVKDMNQTQVIPLDSQDGGTSSSN
ncbi:MAG: hypothetical protein RL741_171 [Actinomycetota bacterium]|jgi:hypothetical protein